MVIIDKQNKRIYGCCKAKDFTKEFTEAINKL